MINKEREITFCKKQCLFQKIEIDDIIQVPNNEKKFLKPLMNIEKSTVKNDPKEINDIISNDSKSLNQNDSNENVDNSKKESNTFKPAEAQEENDINNSILKSIQLSQNKNESTEIQELKKQMKLLQDKISDMSKKKNDYLEKKIEEINRNNIEAAKVDQQFVNELKTMKLSAKQLNSTEIFPHFLNVSHFKELNFVYFKLIDSLCLARYFKSILILK